MPFASDVRRSSKKKSNLTHQEIMNKRHEKKKKKEKKNSVHQKKELLCQYNKLNKAQFSDNKDTSMKIMEIVEDIKDNKGGMNDKHYLDIMDLLMALNKNTMEKHLPFRTPYEGNNYYYYDRTPVTLHRAGGIEINSIYTTFRNTYDILNRYNRLLDEADETF